MQRQSSSAIACASLVVLAGALYAQAANFSFVAIDDGPLVFNNPVIRKGLSWDSVAWAFSTGAVVRGNWTPLAWLSHMLDVEIFGLDPGGHHVTNALLHVVNTLLLFGVLRSLTGAVWRSAFAAALFAAHPLHVESVAWISERRDVLSTAFGLLSLWAYARWTRSGRWPAYLGCCTWLALGLLSKPMLVSLPLLFLLLDYWPLQRLRFDRASRRGNDAAAAEAGNLRPVAALLIEKLPLFALAAASCATTFLSQTPVPVLYLPLGPRVGNAIVSYVIYLAKVVWPARLAVFYPHPYLPGGPEPWSAFQVASALVFLVVVSALVFRFRRRGYLPVGWLWYLVGLAPVIGVVQVGEQALADRYTYLPLIGVFVALSWGAADGVGAGRARRPWLVPLAAAAGVLVIAILAAVSWRQIGYWRDSVTLFSHAVEVTDGNYKLHFQLGKVYHDRGQIEQARQHYLEALAIDPHMSRAHFNLANILRSEGRLEDAIEHYWQAALYSNAPLLRHTLGRAIYQRDGNYGALVEFFAEVAERAPDSVKAQRDLGHALRLNGDLDRAIEAYRRALELRPGDPSTQRSLEDALAAKTGESEP